MLKGHIDATFLHKYTKIQPTLMFTSDVIAMYVPTTNMAYIYATYMS